MMACHLAYNTEHNEIFVGSQLKYSVKCLTKINRLHQMRSNIINHNGEKYEDESYRVALESTKRLFTRRV